MNIIYVTLYFVKVQFFDVARHTVLRYVNKPVSLAQRFGIQSEYDKHNVY